MLTGDYAFAGVAGYGVAINAIGSWDYVVQDVDERSRRCWDRNRSVECDVFGVNSLP